jgi:hypothetical protein
MDPGLMDSIACHWGIKWMPHIFVSVTHSLSMLCFFREKALKTLYVLEEALAMKVYTCGMIWLSLQAVFMEAFS